MEPFVYEQMARVEDSHWWFVSRRAIIDAALRRLNLPSGARILEVGCGTGGNLALLARHGTIHACEYDPRARDYAASRRLGRPEPCRLPDEIPFDDGTFDLVCLFDVLEHIDQDFESLVYLRRKLRPSGYLVLTVPAAPWMWSQHDVVHHHKRRYTSAILSRRVVEAGFTIKHSSHFNFLLFPLIATLRTIRNVLGDESTNDDALPARLLNELLTVIFSLERLVVTRVTVPVGVSLLLFAQPTKR